MKLIRSWHRLAPQALALALLACGAPGCGSEGDDSASGGANNLSDSGTGGADAGGGTGVGGQWNADDAHSQDECVFLGTGGADAWGCSTVTIQLESPLGATDVAIIETSLGRTLTLPSDAPRGLPFISSEGDPTDTLHIESAPPPDSHAPAWVEVTIERDQQEIVRQRFEQLDYSCKAYTIDNWCWEATPVRLNVPSSSP